jgi:hypothetical protein
MTLRAELARMRAPAGTAALGIGVVDYLLVGTASAVGTER